MCLQGLSLTLSRIALKLSGQLLGLLISKLVYLFLVKESTLYQQYQSAQCHTKAAVLLGKITIDKFVAIRLLGIAIASL